MKERNKAVPAVYLILEKDGKILFMRRANTGYQDGNYNLPSGHVEHGELPKEAMIREAKEEIGVDLIAEDLVIAHVSYRPKHDETGDRADYFFRSTTWRGEIINAEPHKCDNLLWESFDNLPTNITPHVRNAIEEIQKGNLYSELGMDFLKKNGVYLLEN